MSWFDRVWGTPLDQISAHAASPSKMLEPVEQRWPSNFTTLLDPTGKVLSPNEYCVVSVAGGSLERLGVKSGERLVSRRVSQDMVHRILKGAVVLVDVPNERSNVGYCLRVFSRLNGDVVEFEDTGKGEKLEPIPSTSVLGVVTYRIESDA